MRTTALSVALLLAFTGVSIAQDNHSGHEQANNGSQTGESASTEAYRNVMAIMHKGMDIDYTGNADVDFVKGMIPHHEGAVAMAKVELEHGTDPELRKLAQEIVAAQEKEITFMKTWLEEHGK